MTKYAKIPKILALSLLLCLFITANAYSQMFWLDPVEGYSSSNNLIGKYFFNPTDSVVITWQHNFSPSPIYLKIGTSYHNYNFRSIIISGNRVSFVPGQFPFNLSTGKYYVQITNSTKNTWDEIVAESLVDTSIEFSNYPSFVVQSTTAPYAIAPRGDITNATPVFQWNPIAGVPAYWVIVSSTPFTISSDSNGNFSANGVNDVWDYITTGTSATYGQISPVSPFTKTAIPLIPENTYNYTVLNLYDPTNSNWVSSVFGGCTTFTLHSPNSLAPPNLTAPADSSVFSSIPVIRFQWDPVYNANNYTLQLFTRTKLIGGNGQQIDVPLWSTSTTNTIVDFPTKVNLSKGIYTWFVIANSSSGTGSMSLIRLFNYTCPTGIYQISAVDADNNFPLTNYQYIVHSTTGGFSPNAPFTVSNSTTTDSIPVDSYAFTCSKSGYFDSTIYISILEEPANNSVNFHLKSYPVTASGIVQDKSNNPVSGANVNFTNTLNNSVLSVSSSSSGSYSISIPRGNYSVTADKPGYLSPPAISVAADSVNIQLLPIILTYDNAVIAGKVFNDNNEPVQLANLTASKGTIIQQTTTDGSGNYSFNLSSGQWTISVSKTGFISPAPKIFNLSPGDNLQGQNFTLVPHANQVSGIVYKIVTNSQGQTSPVPFPGVTVTASPNAGQPVTAVSDASGQYTLNLGSGSWSINASQTGYSSGNPVQMTLTIAQTISGVDFTLTPNPSSVSGVITDPGGAAIEGAAVFVQNIGTTNSLSSGTYLLSLPAGSFALNCSKQGYISPTPVNINLNPGQNLTGINFQLIPNAGIISGLVSSSGQPLSNATVTATQPPATSVSINTAQDGTYILNLQPGKWNIHASKSGFITSADSVVTIGPGQTILNNNFNLIPNTALLNGIVKSGSNLISSAQVIITEVNNPGNSISSLTNTNGEFSITVEAGKSYNITVAYSGYITQTKPTGILLPATTVNFTFDLIPNSSSFSGQVVNNLQVPLAAVKIYLANSQTGVLIDSTVTDASGNYTIGISAGIYKLTAFKRGYTSETITLQINVGQTLTNINFTLNENFALLSGNVKDNSNTPVQGVLVNLTSPSGGATTTTSSTGDFVFSRLLGDNYTISFSKPTYADTIISNYLILDGQSKTLNVVLRKLTCKIDGKITDINLLPISLATVTAVKSANQTFSAVTDNNGNYEIAALDTGSYVVTASKTGYSSNQKISVVLTFQASNGIANITDLSQNNGNVYGLVKDNSGIPVNQASVNITGTQGSVSTVSGSDGRFALTNLARGQYSFDCSKNGYPSFDTSIVVTDSVFVPVLLKPNNSSIFGFVYNQLNHPLTYVVPVTAVSASKTVYHTTTDLSGYFEFHNVNLNTVYMVYTEIFKEGVINDTLFNINVTPSSPFAGPVNLIVTVNNSLIKGNAGTSSALVKLTNLSTNDVKNTTSSGTGTYQFGSLSSGSYRILPQKTGFIFTPVFRDINLGYSDTVSVDFQSTADIGNIIVTALDSAGHLMQGVSAAAINYTSGLVLTGTTDNSGIYGFNGISSGTYSLKLSKTGYFVIPDSAIAIVTNGVTVSKTFTLKPSLGSVSGIVNQYVNSTLSNSLGASISLRNLATGQVFAATSASDGTYNISNLISGNYRITASKAGFLTDSLLFNLTESETKTNVNLILKVSWVKLTGSVVYNNAGLPGVIVTAISSSTLIDTTDANGLFSFDNAAIKTLPGDTTSFQVSISGNGLTSQSKIIAVPASMVGNIISIPQFVLPSGQISLLFSDLIKPVTGLKVTMTRPDGQIIESVSGNDGIFKSTANLFSGTYKFSLYKSGTLVPVDSLLTITLTADTIKFSKSYTLPYSYTALPELKPAAQNNIKLLFTVKPLNATASIFYKLKSAVNFTQAQMVLTDSSFTGIIPALYTTEDVMYYMNIVLPSSTGTSYTYVSRILTITPSGEGILSSLVVKPDLGNSLLRKGDVINLSLVIKDGKNLSLAGLFTGSKPIGHLIWQLSDPSAGQLTFPINNDSTSVNLQLKKAGAYKLNISASLYGTLLTSSFDIQIINPVLKQITVSSDSAEISNKSVGLQLTYSAIDTARRNVYLGSSVKWSVSPVNAGTITQSGFLTPDDSTYFGIITVTAQDQITGLMGSSDITVYAEINPFSSYTLTDDKGMTLSIKPGSVNGNTKIWLSRAQTGPAKKNYSPNDSKSTYVVSDKQYQIVYNALIGLPGDSLNKPAELELPGDNSLRLMDGSKYIAMYDYNKLSWVLRPTTPGSSGNYITNQMNRFGEYALLSSNEPLGLKYVAVLPSPFSPQVAPVKIGYFLSTNAPPAIVTIKIYNVRGELVRTVLESSQQYAGVYGGRKGILQIEWDGKTDNGLTANNGRYIIQITAKDNTGEVSELKQVVLIK
jgi:hypothetical protein